jgi:hypothetical protein
MKPTIDATFDDYPPVIEWEIPNIVLPQPRLFFCVDPICERYHTGGLKVRPSRCNESWHYRGKCPDCGTTFSGFVRVQTFCPKCFEQTYCTRHNRFGVCNSGRGPAKGPWVCLAAEKKATPQSGDEDRDELYD